MRRRLPAIAMAAALLAAACGPAAPASPSAPGQSPAPSPNGGGDVLRVARLADHYNFWHPVQFQTGNQFQWWSAVFNTLVEAEADSRTVVGDLAESWEVSPDATVFTFKLVENATWHDGEPFDADDVMFTITWATQNYDSFLGFAPLWNQIKGADAVKGTTNVPEGLRKVDDFTVEVTLAAPNAEALYALTDMANVILPEHVLKDVTAADVEKVPFTLGTPGVTVGTGPYKLAAFTPDQSVELEAYADYFKGAPKISKIIFKLFADPALAVAQLESGDLDLAFRVSPGEFDRLSAIDTLNVISADNPGIIRIVFRTGIDPWSDKRVRQAVYYAINRQAIVDDFYKGRARVLINPPGFQEYDDLNRYEYNVDTAKQLLADAGYNGQPFRILYNQTFPDAQQVMPLIQSDLQAAGITTELVPTDNEGFLAQYNSGEGHEAFIAVGGSEGLSPDRSRQYFNPTDPKIESGYTNPRIFELWAEGRATADPAARDAAYHELARILNEDVPQANLYSPNLVMVATKRLGGGFDIHLNERETFMDVETWTLE
ncbi:MAG TPA: ABC transporter substrate-binding protein [Candidatus Limnocylindrales bacterium]|jgi:peptide/nickel transport system substrate-binding protein|nr:ABC transporter substrate-binding protein [Candidatus Limnocylindrales bacterium]